MPFSEQRRMHASRKATVLTPISTLFLAQKYAEGEGISVFRTRAD